MRQTIVINVVGLTSFLVGPETPNLLQLTREGAVRPLHTITPAVTCSVQSSFLTGLLPREHGIVGNGWYFRDLSEIWFWRQSNRLVSGEKLWEKGKKLNPSFTCANLFWWYNMYSTVDFSVTPRPLYLANGLKIPDCYTHPPELREELTNLFGEFPLFNFWGPAADITSSQWIAKATLYILRKYAPTLTLVYLPHLDYNLQRLGPNHPAIAQDLRQIDKVCGEIIEYGKGNEFRVIVLSEYGITPVSNPVHINRLLRKAGFLKIRKELGRELLDPGASKAFAVTDHQVAHIYVADQRNVAKVKTLIEELAGIEIVLDSTTKIHYALDHPRSGELVAFSNTDSWFTHYYWLDDDCCPDFARTVDIHRKPGFDPVELFFDPTLSFPKLSIGWRLMKKKLGFRTLMDVIPLDANLVKGSHGRITNRDGEGPLFVSTQPDFLPEKAVEATEVKELILRHVFEK